MQPFGALRDVRKRAMHDMAAALVEAGLYEKEARAMVNTWQDQWFEDEGTRVLYLLPRAWTDRTLPLQVSPQPDAVVRVMVGRAELIIPSVERELREQILTFSTGDARRRRARSRRVARSSRAVPGRRGHASHGRGADKLFVRSAQSWFRPLVLVRMRAALAIDPARVAVDVVLFLPDRHAVLHFVDDVAARGECFGAMTRAHADPHRQIADRERADAMHARGSQHAEALDGFRDDALTFLVRQRFERLVFEARDRVTFVVIAHPAFERGIAAGGRVGELGPIESGVSGAVLKQNAFIRPPPEE